MKTRVILIIVSFISLCWLLSFTMSKPAMRALTITNGAVSELSIVAFDLKLTLAANPIDWQSARTQFKKMRLAFKKTEMLVWYLNRELASKQINGAPLPWLDEHAPQLAIMQPKGLQAIEEQIEAENHENALTLLKEFIAHWDAMAKGFASLQISDRVVLEALRQEIIRISFLELTGFENPAFTDPIAESGTAWQSIVPVVLDYTELLQNQELKKRIVDALYRGNSFFTERSFDEFDRAGFVREAAQPLYAGLIELQETLGIPWYETTGLSPQPVNSREKQLFSTELLNPYYFASLQPEEDNAYLRELGRYLFFDPILSQDVTRSCASCHKPELAFTDGQPKSIATGEVGTVNRNAPTLVNAVFAKSFFYDLRAKPLESQFEHVVFSDKEFNSSYAEITTRLNQSAEYRDLFKKAFASNEGITKHTVTSALAAYVLSLRSFNSPIDKYMRGENVELTPDVKHGFNLFMGKANCGTCHFAPTFSGLVPPFFDDSESEVLGVPATSANQSLDTDLGRAAGVIKQSAPIYEHSFKTVTVRNIALTAPYMHHGVYKTLDEVIEFYNKGGGQGFGYDVPYQTLPADSLGLTKPEQQALIAFMNALTDTTGLTGKPQRLPMVEDEALNKRPIGGKY